MKKVLQNKVIRGILRFAMAITVVAILKYTGLLSGIAATTGGLLLKTGMNDVAVPSPNEAYDDFDYTFKVKSLDGDITAMTELKGKVLFINLWATWCGPCRAEMPTIQSLYEKVDHEKIVFIILSIDNPGMEAKVKNFVANQKFTFPVYTPQGYLPQQLAVPSIPTTFVVSPEGKIVVKKVGMTNFDTPRFKSYLEKLAED